jgi:hypothetical protein
MNKFKESYKPLKDTYTSKEKFFVSYAVRGPIVNPSYGLRDGLPINHPIPGPVTEPSPLNTRYMYHAPGWSNKSCPIGVL